MGDAVSATPSQALQAALRGRPERPLVVPIASAVVGELQALGPEAVLADPGKLSMLVREVAVSPGADAAVAEFGTFWDAEALGMSLEAQVVFVVEEADPPPDPSAYAAALAPLWATIRFYGALGVLHLAGGADTWAPVLEREGPFLPCFDPEASPGLASVVAGRSFGLALPPRPVTARARELASSSRCVLLTHTRELAAVVPGRALASCGAELRGAAA